jgi:hypothetical protein
MISNVPVCITPLFVANSVSLNMQRRLAAEKTCFLQLMQALFHQYSLCTVKYYLCSYPQHLDSLFPSPRVTKKFSLNIMVRDSLDSLTLVQVGVEHPSLARPSEFGTSLLLRRWHLFQIWTRKRRLRLIKVGQR